MAYQLRHYHADEFVPNGYGIDVMDERILMVADQVRDILGVPCLINYGDKHYCGYRPPECTVGAPHSQHRLGRAVDIHPQGMAAEDARELIIKASELGAIPYLGRMEADVNWCHCDLGPRKNGKVYLFHA